MLYDAYEMQRSFLAGASAMANFGAGLLNNPTNPFAYLGGGNVMASALEVFAHASAPRGKPEFGLTHVEIDGKRVAVHEEIALRAYHIYLERKGAPGNPFEDWKRAERELMQLVQKPAAAPRKRKATVTPIAA